MRWQSKCATLRTTIFKTPANFEWRNLILSSTRYTSCRNQTLNEFQFILEHSNALYFSGIQWYSKQHHNAIESGSHLFNKIWRGRMSRIAFLDFKYRSSSFSYIAQLASKTVCFCLPVLAIENTFVKSIVYQNNIKLDLRVEFCFWSPSRGWTDHFKMVVE